MHHSEECARGTSTFPSTHLWLLLKCQGQSSLLKFPITKPTCSSHEGGPSMVRSAAFWGLSCEEGPCLGQSPPWGWGITLSLGFLWSWSSLQRVLWLASGWGHHVFPLYSLWVCPCFWEEDGTGPTSPSGVVNVSLKTRSGHDVVFQQPRKKEAHFTYHNEG